MQVALKRGQALVKAFLEFHGPNHSVPTYCRPSGKTFWEVSDTY